MEHNAKIYVAGYRGLVGAALMRKFHEAKVANAPEIVAWGTGTPRREFLDSDDMAEACIYVMNLPQAQYSGLLGCNKSMTGRFEPPFVNIGVGEDVTIHALAESVRAVVEYQGCIEFDKTKPDGTPQKLMNVSKLNSMDWKAPSGLATGLALAYRDFILAIECICPAH